MKFVKAVSETSSWLPFWMIYTYNSSYKTKKKHNLQWYSDLGTGSWRYSVTVEQYTYTFLYYEFTEDSNNLDTTNLNTVLPTQKMF